MLIVWSLLAFLPGRSPTRLNHAGNIPAQAEIAKANPAQGELPNVPSHAPTRLASMVLANRELLWLL
jgi:hypothetical protein